MTKASTWLVLSVVWSLGLCLSPSGFADDSTVNNYNNQQAGTVADTSGTTAVSQSDVTRGYLHNEVAGITPQVGIINFIDSTGGVSNRGAAGLTVDFNATGVVNHAVGEQAATDLYVGPQFGLFYSHIGTVGDNVFGSNTVITNDNGTQSIASGTPGANLIMIPVDLKVGWNVGFFRLSVRGGGNVMYRNVADAVTVGLNPNSSSGSNWSIFPNVGADIEFGGTGSVAAVVRPDWTIAGPNRLFALTAGLAFPIG